jgi:hypothetical protein
MFKSLTLTPNKEPASRLVRLAGSFISRFPLIPPYSKESQNIDKQIQITKNVSFGDPLKDGALWFVVTP